MKFDVTDWSKTYEQVESRSAHKKTKTFRRVNRTNITTALQFDMAEVLLGLRRSAIQIVQINREKF